MTGRQRILTSIGHREADRVARDMGATPSSTISAIAMNRLNDYLKLELGPAKIYDVVQQVAQPDERLLDYYGIDVELL